MGGTGTAPHAVDSSSLQAPFPLHQTVAVRAVGRDRREQTQVKRKLDGLFFVLDAAGENKEVHLGFECSGVLLTPFLVG